MKIVKKEYTPIKGCSNFWSWLWFTADYPYGTMYGDDRANWFRYCGSANRVLIRRRFGFSKDVQYYQEELNTGVYLVLHLTSILMTACLLVEIGLLLLIRYGCK